MQNRRGLFAGMQSGRLSGFVPYKGTKDLPNAGRISRFIRNFVDMKVALCQFSMEWEAAARNLRRAEALVAQAQQAADDAIAKTLAALPALVGKVVFWIVLLVAALVGVPFLLGFWAGGWRERARRRKADRTKQE